MNECANMLFYWMYLTKHPTTMYLEKKKEKKRKKREEKLTHLTTWLPMKQTPWTSSQSSWAWRWKHLRGKSPPSPCWARWTRSRGCSAATGLSAQSASPTCSDTCVLMQGARLPSALCGLSGHGPQTHVSAGLGWRLQSKNMAVRTCAIL